MAQTANRAAWTVVLAGTGINLAFGVIYAWSVISKRIPDEWGWSEAERSLPYSLAVLIFALVMVPAGRLQDRFGPRWIATLGGLLVGAGMLIASQATSVLGFSMGFGVLVGAGVGLGYASATPPAVKWFPPHKTGLVTGIVVAGFGLASVYIAPLAQSLITSQGLSVAMMILGAAFVVVVCGLSQLLRNPPPDHQRDALGAPPPAKGNAKATTGVDAGAKAVADAPPIPKPAAVDYGVGQMLRTRQFWLLWLMFMLAAGAGLMFIGKAAKITSLQANSEAGFILVALLAVGNAAGRIVAGVLSDRIGRARTMLVVFLFQALLLVGLRWIDTLGPLVAVTMLVGFNYGANLSVFPSVTKDWFGLKNFGVNYGLVFTAWGVGGYVMPYLSGRLFDAAKAADPAGVGSFQTAYLVGAGALLVAAVLALIVRPPAVAAAKAP
jgi:OFA family oxalate/formate antiporter-like MFS transporter